MLVSNANLTKSGAVGRQLIRYNNFVGSVFEKLQADEYADEEDAEEYLAERTFWVPKEARWGYLQANAKQPTIGKLVDDAIWRISRRDQRPTTELCIFQ